MNLEDCVKQNLIKKNNAQKNMELVSLKKAKNFLTAIQVNLDARLFDVAVISGYNSIFCCNKALLYSKDFSERSHNCLVIAIRELFTNEKQLINLLNSVDDLRLTRHKVQYSGLDADFEMSEFVKDLAEEYFEITKKILKKDLV